MPGGELQLEPLFRLLVYKGNGDVRSNQDRKKQERNKASGVAKSDRRRY